MWMEIVLLICLVILGRLCEYAKQKETMFFWLMSDGEGREVENECLGWKLPILHGLGTNFGAYLVYNYEIVCSNIVGYRVRDCKQLSSSLWSRKFMWC